jgi:Zn-dependent M28 family amino/carboxypeptidase
MAGMLVLLTVLLAQDFPKEALKGIRADEAFEHVRILASDEYEGRKAGTPGNDKAAQYLVAALKKWGLKPAGTGGEFLQPFDGGGKTNNVLAWIEGSDPDLKGEYVAVGAHFDHIGVSGRGKDRINNGADDNASGTAVVLEVAQAFAGLREKPKRSILFGWWSAEEDGLLGSRHFVRNPTVDIKKIVAYLNLDMVGRKKADEIDIEGTGCSPDLRKLFDKVNAQGLFKKISYEVAEVKSDTDHYPFYEAEVPAVEFFSGYHADYHKPGDHAEKITVEKLERTGRFVALAAWDLAQSPARPAWQSTK